MVQRLCEALCRHFGQPESSWPLVRNAIFLAPVFGVGLLALYCLAAWLL